MSKAERILSIYDRLTEGRILVKRDESVRFNVDMRTIQRDLEDIRAYLMNSRQVGLELVYDKREKGYRIRRIL